MIPATKIVIDPFSYYQFDDNNSISSQYLYCKQEIFQQHINSIYKHEDIVDGYAPFCKHLFIENFLDAKASIIKITNQVSQENITTKYQARTKQELPVLIRYIPIEKIQIQKAKYLDIILYTKEQIQLENEAMGNTDPNKDIDYEYGIIYVKPQDINYEIPMDPITMMRNTLGKQEGGSGVSLNKEQYLKSVEFWTNHIEVL